MAINPFMRELMSQEFVKELSDPVSLIHLHQHPECALCSQMKELTSLVAACKTRQVDGRHFPFYYLVCEDCHTEMITRPDKVKESNVPVWSTILDFFNRRDSRPFGIVPIKDLDLVEDMMSEMYMSTLTWEEFNGEASPESDSDSGSDTDFSDNDDEPISMENDPIFFSLYR